MPACYAAPSSSVSVQVLSPTSFSFFDSTSAMLPSHYRLSADALLAPSVPIARGSAFPQVCVCLIMNFGAFSHSLSEEAIFSLFRFLAGGSLKILLTSHAQF